MLSGARAAAFPGEPISGIHNFKYGHSKVTCALCNDASRYLKDDETLSDDQLYFLWHAHYYMSGDVAYSGTLDDFIKTEGPLRFKERSSMDTLTYVPIELEPMTPEDFRNMEEDGWVEHMDSVERDE